MRRQGCQTPILGTHSTVKFDRFNSTDSPDNDHGIHEFDWVYQRRACDKKKVSLESPYRHLYRTWDYGEKEKVL